MNSEHVSANSKAYRLSAIKNERISARYTKRALGRILVKKALKFMGRIFCSEMIAQMQDIEEGTKCDFQIIPTWESYRIPDIVN